MKTLEQLLKNINKKGFAKVKPSTKIIQFTGEFENVDIICDLLHPHYAVMYYDINNPVLKIKFSKKDKDYRYVHLNDIIVFNSKQDVEIYTQGEFCMTMYGGLL